MKAASTRADTSIDGLYRIVCTGMPVRFDTVAIRYRPSMDVSARVEAAFISWRIPLSPGEGMVS